MQRVSTQQPQGASRLVRGADEPRPRPSGDVVHRSPIGYHGSVDAATILRRALVTDTARRDITMSDIVELLEWRDFTLATA